MDAVVETKEERALLSHLVSSAYLCALVVLRHTVLLVNQERVEDVQVVERRSRRQHQPVLADVQNQRAR